MTTTQWNQIVTTVEQLPAEKQNALARLVSGWLSSFSTLPEQPIEVTGRRRAGSAAGQFVVPPEFDDPLPEEMQAAFDGRL